ncbi:MAG TPA: hypothetical protein VG713_10375 [Pirellulales bacterium]|nr:hypothetical protein [Pirellulales bacterium]
MKFLDFVNLVEQMRTAQRLFFGAHGQARPELMRECKRLERLVDSALRNGSWNSAEGNAPQQ